MADRAAGPCKVHLEKPSREKYPPGERVSLRVMVIPPSDAPGLVVPVSVEVKRGKVVADNIFLSRREGEPSTAGELKYEGEWEIPASLRPGAYSVRAIVPRVARDSDTAHGKTKSSTGDRTDVSETWKVTISAANGKH